jgi:drug/metabolite transporter (DMT)-like permease
MTYGEVSQMLDSHKRRRPLRVVAYTALALGNTVILADPTKSFENVPDQLRFFWNVLMLLGCLLAVYGAIRDRYLAEFIGMPLIWAGIGAFIVVLVAAWASGPWAFACFLTCILAVLVSRGLDLFDLVRSTRRAERRRM